MSILRIAGALALVCLGLSGCGGLSGASPADPLSGLASIQAKVAAFTAADVQAALDDANKNGDVVGALCWGTVQKALPSFQVPQGAGGAALIQLGRDAQKKIPDVADACAGILPTGLLSVVRAAL